MYYLQLPLSPTCVSKSTGINSLFSLVLKVDKHERKSGSINVFSRSAGPPQLQKTRDNKKMTREKVNTYNESKIHYLT